MPGRFFVLILAGLGLMAPTAVIARQPITTGVIQGTVTDATGSSLPGVTVEARNVDTNLARSVVTDNDGRFVFLQLTPGRCQVTFTLGGFAARPSVLTVGQAVSLPASLKVSGVAETVTVSRLAQRRRIESHSGRDDAQQLMVETMPILGRKFEDLLTLTPGVSIVQGPDGDEINFAGQRGIFNNISLDGDCNNGFFGEQAGGQRAAIDITLDAVKEFQVIATEALQFDRTGGGVVNVIAKSGTNTPAAACFTSSEPKD